MSESWLLPQLLLHPGLTIIEGDAGSRFLAYIVSQIVAQPSGGVVLFSENGNFILHHQGIRRVLWVASDPSIVATQVDAFLTASFSNAPPIDLLDASGLRLDTEQNRSDFETTYLAPGLYDVLVFAPVAEAGAMLPHIRRWSWEYGIASIVEGENLTPAVEDVALTLERGETETFGDLVAQHLRLTRWDQDDKVLSQQLLDFGRFGFRVPSDPGVTINGDGENVH